MNIATKEEMDDFIGHLRVRSGGMRDREVERLFIRAADALDAQAMEIHELREANQMLANKLESGPKVKPLVWNNGNADSPFGRYWLLEMDKEEWIPFRVHGGYDCCLSDHNALSKKEAEQVCFADYTRRVLECLEV